MAVTLATIATDNVHLFPSVILLGALLVPGTFVVYVYERLSITADALPALVGCFVVGGLVGLAAAAVLEYETVLDLGALPILAVGVIEESAKLVFPLLLFAQRRFVTPSEGVLFGVAAGMGFAFFETMGYGLVALIQSGGGIGPTEEVLAIRGLLSPAGHAAWTGLVCAALWRVRARHPHAGSYLWVPAAFTAAVVLHALWDGTDFLAVRAAVALASASLLAAQLRRVRAPLTSLS
jgi:RsiW-degrading membrane proteinase PrsW (M82 family)